MKNCLKTIIALSVVIALAIVAFPQVDASAQNNIGGGACDAFDASYIDADDGVSGILVLAFSDMTMEDSFTISVDGVTSAPVSKTALQGDELRILSEAVRLSKGEHDIRVFDGALYDHSATVTVGLIPVAVTLDRTSMVLNPGDETTLTVTVSPSGSYFEGMTWSSDDVSVATVDQNGRVRAVSDGTATLTVDIGAGLYASCTVTVTTPVTGVSLDRTSVTLDVDDIMTLQAVVTPSGATNPAVSWTSSDPTVATVDQNGTVTALKAGTSTVTVSTVDGGHSATCVVTVLVPVPGTVPVTGVVLDRDSCTLTEGDGIRLTATVSPSDATHKTISWSSSDPSVVKVDQSGNITALKAGTATVSVITIDGGFSDQCAVTVEPLSESSGDDTTIYIIAAIAVIAIVAVGAFLFLKRR